MTDLVPAIPDLDAVASREARATVASLVPLLRPRSIAVIGVSRRPGTVGAAILRKIRAAGFEGRVYAVNPHAVGSDLDGVPYAASPADLPEPPDLAVICVPAAGAAPAAEACGRRGARAVVVISSGLNADQGRALIDACRHHGMRLVGPNCLGVAEGAGRLDATFAAGRVPPGSAGVVVQSGGVGIALMEHLSRLGIGVSSFVSVGDKYDVSANDMLMWWEGDPDTRLGLLPVESFGNPRRFARTARRVAERMPLLTVLAGCPEPEARRALFRQAGVIAVDDLGDMVGAAALLAHQPLPAGPRVAIVSNAGGGGGPAADACSGAGLGVPALTPRTQEALAKVLPPCATVTNPVDTTAAVTPEDFARALELVAADESVDAVLALIAPTALGDLSTALRIPAENGKPVASVVFGQSDVVTVDESGTPVYAFPGAAVRALAAAWSYASWRDRPRGSVLEFPCVCPDEAAPIVQRFLREKPDGGWLPPLEAFRLLESYGLPLAPWRWASSEDAAVRKAAELGGAVALKAHVPGVVNKAAAGALQLDLRCEDDVRSAYRWLEDRFGDDLLGVLVQRMAEDGVEVLCGLVQEEVFGPLVVFGTGGTGTEAPADRSARLAPLTDLEAYELIREARVAPLLFGHTARPAGDLRGLRDVLLRLSRLAADHPRIAEVDLDPLIVRPGGVTAVNARVRVAPHRDWDPYRRRPRS